MENSDPYAAAAKEAKFILPIIDWNVFVSKAILSALISFVLFALFL